MTMKIMLGTHITTERSIGKSRGYGVHATETIKALKMQGVKFTSSVLDADLVLHQAPASIIEFVEGIPNVLYTAWETEYLTDEMVEMADKMNAVICTSTFVMNTFKKYLPRKKMYVCPLGVDKRFFQYKRRKEEKPFIFLWVGAPDVRKGWDLIREAWQFFQKDSSCALILKTTKEEGRLEYSGNVIVDTRDMTTNQLAEVYHIANCFVFPSFGEGFGLTLAEAMATGLPSIYTPWGGVLDFINPKLGFPLRYEMVDVQYGRKAKGAKADLNSLVDTMIKVKQGYHKASVKAKRASEQIRQNYTWEHTGIKMKTILEEILYGIHR